MCEKNNIVNDINSNSATKYDEGVIGYAKIPIEETYLEELYLKVKNKHQDKDTIFKNYDFDKINEIKEIKQKWLTDVLKEYYSLRKEYIKIENILNDDVYTYLDNDKREFMNQKYEWLFKGLLLHKKLLDKELYV